MHTKLPTMDTYVKLLQSYGGRDKIMRTSAYVAVLLSGQMQSKSKTRLTAFAKQISAARVVLRLFDDVPMWRVTRNWAAEEKDSVSWLCSVISNLSSQIYLPIEHVAWMADHDVISIGSSTHWWTCSTVCWALSLFLNIIRNIRKISLLRRRREKLKRHKILESPDKSGDAEAAYIADIRVCAEQELDEYLILVKNAADFVVAINGLPWRPFLWAGKFSPPKNAVFGVVSSVVGLYLLIKPLNAAS